MAAPAQIISSIQTWSILQQTRGTKTSHHLWCLLGGSTTSILWVSWHSCQRQEMHAGFKKLLYHSKFGGCNLYWKTHWCQEYQAAFFVKNANNIPSQWLSLYHHGGLHPSETTIHCQRYDTWIYFRALCTSCYLEDIKDPPWTCIVLKAAKNSPCALRKPGTLFWR